MDHTWRFLVGVFLKHIWLHLIPFRRFFDEIIRNSKIRVVIFTYYHSFLLSDYDESVKSKFLPLSDASRLFHCYAIPQSSNTSNSHKMVYSHHFIPFSLFGVSININCLFVQAQTQFILLTLTSFYSILKIKDTKQEEDQWTCI